MTLYGLGPTAGAADKQTHLGLGQPAAPHQPLELQAQPLHTAALLAQPQRRGDLPGPQRLPRIREHFQHVTVGHWQHRLLHARLPHRHRDPPDTHPRSRRGRLHGGTCDRAVQAQRGPNPGVAILLDTTGPPSDPRGRPPPAAGTTAKDLQDGLPSNPQPGAQLFLGGQPLGQLGDPCTQRLRPGVPRGFPRFQLCHQRAQRRFLPSPHPTRRSSSHAARPATPAQQVPMNELHPKSIRHGHISTLHIWWARRPLAACRAVVLAALLPDPGDTACPESFRNIAADALRKFRDTAGGSPINDNPEELRAALLQFISRFAAWEASTESTFLDCARALVAAAHPDERPLVVDPFAGGGAIPLEALRVGTDAWAADYNPVAALLLKVVLEDIPRYGERLADAVRYWGAWVKDRVEADLTRS